MDMEENGLGHLEFRNELRSFKKGGRKMYIIKTRQKNWVGQILRGDSLYKDNGGKDGGEERKRKV